MRRLVVLLALAAALAACASAGPVGGGPAPRTVTVGMGAKGHTITVHPGDTVRVRLTSTYWSFAPESGGVLSRGTHRYHAKSTRFPGTGAGTVTATFQALKHGTATITAARRICGEALACTPGRGSYRITVVVH
jgi:predicted secreted protein